MTLQPGDAIKTGDTSSAEITFFEGSTIELEVSTEISVAELGISDTGSTTIRLKQLLGTTISRVKKLTDTASSFDIETPAAIAAVRGSIMNVTVASNGRTIVANEEGDISIVVSGTEYTIREGMQRTITPGHPPSAEMPIPTQGGYSPPPPQARLQVTMQASPSEAGVGDNITYTYSLHNTGDLSFNNISVSSNVSRNATYQSGDTNANSKLDPNETWILTSTYSVQESDYPQVTANATFSATTSTGITLVGTETATTLILPVFITGPADGTTVNLRTLNVSGIIFDPTISEGSVTVNGGPAEAITTSEGGDFSANVTLADGQNTVTVTVANDQGQTASDTITVNLVPYAIRIELTWNTDNSTDLDAHFIRPGGSFGDNVTDCYYGNKNPDWGDPDATVDNPSLDRDDYNGFGPEIITLLLPYDEGVYTFIVYYNTYSGSGTDPTFATVRIWINEGPPIEFSKEMTSNDVWVCALIDWPSGEVSQPS
jgi:uncharacterized repeat protein (TIGR01451 family)